MGVVVPACSNGTRISTRSCRASPGSPTTPASRYKAHTELLGKVYPLRLPQVKTASASSATVRHRWRLRQLIGLGRPSFPAARRRSTGRGGGGVARLELGQLLATRRDSGWDAGLAIARPSHLVVSAKSLLGEGLRHVRCLLCLVPFTELDEKVADRSELYFADEVLPVT